MKMESYWSSLLPTASTNVSAMCESGWEALLYIAYPIRFHSRKTSRDSARLQVIWGSI